MISIYEINFSCAHFYKNSEWSDSKNLEVFGKCFTNYGHGHDYRLKLYAKGNLGSVANSLEKLKNQLDHQHLNFVIPEFKTKIPTTENLAQYCLEQISKNAPGAKLQKLVLYETPEIWVEIDLYE